MGPWRTGRSGCGDPTGRVPVLGILGQQRHGGGRPDVPRATATTVWRGIRTPDGPGHAARRAPDPATATSTPRPGAPAPTGRSTTCPAMLGADDDPTGFEPLHPLRGRGPAAPAAPPVRRQPPGLGGAGRRRSSSRRSPARRRSPGSAGWSTGTASGRPARAASCGSGSSRAPTPSARIPSWEWLRMHIDPARSRTLVRAATVADTLERLTRRRRRRQAPHACPAIGEWTVRRGAVARLRRPRRGQLRRLPHRQGHRLGRDRHAVRRRASCAAFLEPWRPQRNRAVVLIHGLAGGRPRRGPRMAPRTHLPVRQTVDPSSGIRGAGAAGSARTR